MSTLPPFQSYAPAYWSGITAINKRTGTLGLSFGLFSGEQVNLHITQGDLISLGEAIAFLRPHHDFGRPYREIQCQCESCVGNRHLRGSTPDAGGSSSPASNAASRDSAS